MSIMWVNLIKLSLDPPRIQLIFLTKIISPWTQNWLFDNYTIIIQQVAVVRVGIDLTRDLFSVPALDCTRTLSLLTDIKHISIFHFQKYTQKYTKVYKFQKYILILRSARKQISDCINLLFNLSILLSSIRQNIKCCIVVIFHRFPIKKDY